MFIALGVMSVQLLLLPKSIYWTWVYCKITKVKTWIHLALVASPLLPSCAWESRVPHSLALCLLPTMAPLPMTAKPPSVAGSLPGVPLAGPLREGDQESNLKKQTLKKRGNGPFPPPGFSVAFMTLPWATVWDGDAGYGQEWPKSSLSVKTLTWTSS